MRQSARELLKRLLEPVRRAAGRFVLPPHIAQNTIIWKAARLITAEQVPGDYLEFGVFRGR
ncbi:MAG: hypothetical protein JXR94_16130, partial [Candidatus Hydrogenedentes bacterium]|nr:hypothetical protein [Candidatus Hydrogenedentota bacterium]